MNILLQDLRSAMRALRGSPGFTAVAVLTLALGIGANTAIFSLVNGILLRPLPYRDADRLVSVWTQFRAQGLDKNPTSVPELEDLQREVRSFEAVSAHTGTSANLTAVDEPERIQAMVVTANFFSVLGVGAALGRTFEPEDDAGGIGTVAVISHGLWQRRFGGETAVLGKRMKLDDDDFTVIGVMPPSFGQPGDLAPMPVEIWVPTNFRIPQLLPDQRDARFVNVIARLRPGVTLEQAREEMRSVAVSLAGRYPDAYPEAAGWGLVAIPLFDEIVGNVRPALLVLLAAVGFVLLIACANVANLMLARGAARRREIALRSALGARRIRIVRQLLTESVVLAVIGGAAGLLAAAYGTSALVALAARTLPRALEVGLDLRVLAFTAALSLLTGIAFGVAPAFQASTANVRAVLGEGGRGATAGRERSRTRATLVVAEVALALVLLIGAGLLLKSFRELLSLKPGFEVEGLLTAQVSLPVPNEAERGAYSHPARRVEFFRRVLEQAEALPGIRSAAVTSLLPLTGSAGGNFEIEGRARPPSEPPPSAEIRSVSPSYFRVMGITLREGRGFTASDKFDAPGVAIVNRTLVARYWPGESPLGRRILTGGPGSPGITIVGVVEDVRQATLEDPPRPELYRPYTQNARGTMALVLRTAGDPERFASAVRAAVRAVDREQPVYDVVPMRRLVSRAVAQRRLSAVLLGLFSAVALALAAVGIYGVASHGVLQRRHEIGIRMAVGARREDILRMILGHGMTLALAGVALGTLAALALTRGLRNLLYGVSATDPATFAGIALLLVGVALISCWIPARRATALDPVVVLRDE